MIAASPGFAFACSSSGGTTADPKRSRRLDQAYALVTRLVRKPRHQSRNRGWIGNLAQRLNGDRPHFVVGVIQSDDQHRQCRGMFHEAKCSHCLRSHPPAPIAELALPPIDQTERHGYLGPSPCHRTFGDAQWFENQRGENVAMVPGRRQQPRHADGVVIVVQSGFDDDSVVADESLPTMKDDVAHSRAG